MTVKMMDKSQMADSWAHPNPEVRQAAVGTAAASVQPAISAVPPLAYGYLRIDLLGDRDPAACQDCLMAVAGTLGCQLCAVF